MRAVKLFVGLLALAPAAGTPARASERDTCRADAASECFAEAVTGGRRMHGEGSLESKAGPAGFVVDGFLSAATTWTEQVPAPVPGQFFELEFSVDGYEFTRPDLTWRNHGPEQDEGTVLVFTVLNGHDEISASAERISSAGDLVLRAVGMCGLPDGSELTDLRLEVTLHMFGEVNPFEEPTHGIDMRLDAEVGAASLRPCPSA